jgi:hypothetical protein
MVREGPSINPTAVIVHVVAIAVGLFLGWLAMDAITPDAPSATEPGAVVPEIVAGDDEGSFFRSPNLEPALDELAEQYGNHTGIVRLRIEPDGIETETRSGQGFAPGEVDPEAPLSLVLAVDALRGGQPIGLGEISFIELVQTKDGPRWYIQLDINKDIGSPPWTYGAGLDGTDLQEGVAPPKPI